MRARLLLCLATPPSQHPRDAAFHQWCSDVGIDCPGGELRTTPDSVAGRGVFSTRPLSEDDEIISIPLYAACTQDNAREYFPTLEQRLKKYRRRPGLLRRIWNRLLRRRSNEERPDSHWQAELVAYTLQSLEVDHPWSTWIEQWQREDPMQSLVDDMRWRDDESVISDATSDFHAMAPSVPELKIGAAMGIRLQELDEYTSRYEGRVPTSEKMYTTLISRAVGLAENVTAILPMHDMINHSAEPNVGLAFAEDETFKIVALGDIKEGEELFLRYMDVRDAEGQWDEDKAAWLLVQWGIPSSPSDFGQETEVQ
ncbi:hypothetical protein ACHAXT_011880 [Thalassiosira profunda]